MELVIICTVLIYLLAKFFSFKTEIRKTKRLVKPIFSSLFYRDTSSVEKDFHGRYFYSEKYDIVGKPDYIFKRFKTLTIVEIKTKEMKDKKTPYESDLMQVLTYMLIISEEFPNYKVKTAKIVYKDCMFVIKKSRILMHSLENTLNRMREMMKTGIEICEPSFEKCRYCVCNLTVCDFGDYNDKCMKSM